VNLDELLAAGPRFHTTWEGEPHTWQLSREVLEVLDRELQPGMRTLETGEGLSTVLFAAHGCRHTCVTPNPDAVARIREFCEAHGIGLDSVVFDIRPSQAALPGLPGTELDVVLIDGGHGFPIPFIDFFYAGAALRIGGLLVVDDTQLWTGRMLREFLAADPAWELVQEMPRRAALFRPRGGVDVAAFHGARRRALRPLAPARHLVGPHAQDRPAGHAGQPRRPGRLEAGPTGPRRGCPPMIQGL
jgi:predicted O-methyltransferase YrrM